jgi:hypothetical protein
MSRRSPQRLSSWGRWLTRRVETLVREESPSTEESPTRRKDWLKVEHRPALGVSAYSGLGRLASVRPSTTDRWCLLLLLKPEGCSSSSPVWHCWWALPFACSRSRTGPGILNATSLVSLSGRVIVMLSISYR